MKNQALFSSNDKSKTLKCGLLQFLFGALRVKDIHLLQIRSNKNNLGNFLISLKTYFETPH